MLDTLDELSVDELSVAELSVAELNVLCAQRSTL